ncbi:DUF4351 domain-containing protein [Myxacorys almedinensis]|uniref:DUF4351 domain-containing protein n=1 Tax=Myxacorys almedinensis A TaxID=2690445 RepID=A0A8J8CKQ4_9CYAN|nr:DUF4351 domain-containing protein [Myxacorys almedinensis]NDJ16895.1 DUF4351 domain-containing protein [Myxacorys almedinensis A]
MVAIAWIKAIALVTRQLTRRLGHELSEEMRAAKQIPQGSRLFTLSLPMLEDLGEALLDFTRVADLEAWLEKRDRRT